MNSQIRVSYRIVKGDTGKPGPIQARLVDIRRSGWNIKYLWLGFLPEDKYQDQPSLSCVQQALDACHRLMSEPMCNLSAKELVLCRVLAGRCGRWQAQEDAGRSVAKTPEEIRLTFGLLYQAWNFGRELMAYVKFGTNRRTTEFYQWFDRQKFRRDKRMRWFLLGYLGAARRLPRLRAANTD